MSTFGRNLRAARLALGLSQTELGRRIGIPYNRISEIENNRANPTIDRMEKLAEAVGSTVSHLTRDNTDSKN